MVYNSGDNNNIGKHERRMIVLGIITMWVLSVIKEVSIGRIRVLGVWILLYALGISQRQVVMQIGVLGGMYNRDNVIVNMEGYIYIISILLMLGYMRGEGKKREEGWEMEMEVVLLSIMGMVLLIWSYDLVSTYLGIELQSLALYMMTSRSGDGKGAIAGIKYYILGILSSSILLLGIVMMYQGMGTTHNEGIRMMQETGGMEIEKIGGRLMISGILFKLALPPFHNWGPDVYDGVETRITSWIAVMGKVSYMIYIYKVRIYEMGMIEGVIIGALVIGSVMGLTQNRIKRLLAYSTINQMGFQLIGLLTTGVISRVSYIFYNVQYWITLVNSFSIMIALGGRYDIRYISSLYREAPVLLMALVINIYSLVGIPPLMGFFGKQMIISGGLLGGYVGIVTIGIITSVISGAYYLRVIKEIMLKREEKRRERREEGGAVTWVISIITLLTVFYGVNPRLIMLPITIMVS